MLTVSLVGKKFSCNIQLKISAEKDGGGLELALKAGEKCSNRPQAISNVTASLNITIQGGCNNYVTKCKEMLMFLQEQALPKTMNIIKVHMVNRETKGLVQKDDSRLFRCLRPSKRNRERIRDRSTSRDRLSARGYTSDSEQLYRHPQAVSTDSLSSSQSNKMDTIATPRMSRHRLKNAALLRDRKQREASRERNEASSKANKEQDLKTKTTSKEIHLPVTETKKNKHKLYSARSFEKDVDSQGETTYDGGSESSLRAKVMEDNEAESETDKDGSKNVDIQSVKVKNIENEEENDVKGVTDSDMSVDSLECLDMSSKEIEEKKKKKKRKVRKREEKLQSSKEDVQTSSPCVVSQIPSLALPEDLQDSPTEHAHHDNDNITLGQYEKSLKINSAFGCNSSLRSSSLSSDDFTKLLSDAAQQIVDDIIRSALKKCGKPTPTNSENLDTRINDQGQKRADSVQSGRIINDDVIKGSSRAIEPGEIKLEFIEDNAVAESRTESRTDKVLDTNSDSTSTQVCEENTLVRTDISILTDVKIENELGVSRDNVEESSSTEGAMAGKLPVRITKDLELKKRTSCEVQPDGQVVDKDAVALATQQDTDLQQNRINVTNEANNNRNTEDENIPSMEAEKALGPEERCSIEKLVTDDDKNGEECKESSANERDKTDFQKDPSSETKAEFSGRDVNAQSDSGIEKSISGPEASNKQPGHTNQPITLFDTHVNITNRIITSVSQALHLQAIYTTPSPSPFLTFDPDVPLPYYVAPERGLEHFIDKELTSNNQYALEGSQPQHSKEAAKEPQKKERDSEKSRTPLRKQKSEETFHRFVQSQRGFASPSARDSAGDETCGNQDPDISIPGVNTSYINTSQDTNPKSGYCFFVVGSDATGDDTQKFDDARASGEEGNKDLNRTFSVIQPRGRRHGERPKSSVYNRSISDQNERKRWITSIQEPDLLRTVHQRSASADTRSRTARNNKCISCPVLSEEDIVLEGLESHHKDVCNSLSQRTWVVLRVHELWKAKKPLEALKMCMELTGIKAADVSNTEGISSSNPLDKMSNKDNALFLNILQQLPSSCSTWSLNMCNLLLPELKRFISTRIHTSHVDMACNVLQVIVKKVSGVVLKVQTENKEKPEVLKNCVSHLRDVSDRISQVLVARRGKIHTALSTEDPIALKPVLRELLSTIQTLLRIYVD